MNKQIFIETHKPLTAEEYIEKAKYELENYQNDDSEENKAIYLKSARYWLNQIAA